MNQANGNIYDELERKQRATAMIVFGVLALTLLLLALAFIGQDSLYRGGDPKFAFGLQLAMLFFGLGAIALRRTKFSAMRLQDIAGVRGLEGLLNTLQKTTVQIAFISLGIALMGFISMMITGNFLDMIRGGVISIAVLLYCYPRRAAWQTVVQGIIETGDADAQLTNE